MASDDLGLAHPSAQTVEGDEAMVERVARVLAPPAWAVAGTRHDRPWLAASRRFSIRNAKAAIEVMRPALSAEGSATIAAARKPEEPTQEMIQAGLEALQTENVKDASLNGKVARIYGAMVSAAPEAS